MFSGLLITEKTPLSRHFVIFCGGLACLIGAFVLFLNARQIAEVPTNSFNLRNQGFALIVAAVGLVSSLKPDRPQLSLTIGFVLGASGLHWVIAEQDFLKSVFKEAFFFENDAFLIKPNNQTAYLGLLFFLIGVALLIIALNQRQRHLLSIVATILSVFVLIFALTPLIASFYSVTRNYDRSFQTNSLTLLYLGFVLVATGLIIAIFYIRHTRHLSEIHPLFFLLVTLTISLNLSFWLSVKQKANQAQNLQLALNLFSARTIFDLQLNTTANALQRMGERWLYHQGNMNFDEWESDSANYRKTTPGLIATEYVTPDYHIKWVEPEEPNANVKGMNLAFEATRRNALETAKTQRKLVVSDVIELVQGGKGFLIINPLFIGDHFYGYLMQAFRANAFFQPAYEILRQLNITILLKDARSEPVFSNLPSGFTLQQITWNQQQPLANRYQSWHIQVGQTGDLALSPLGELKTSTAISASLISVLIIGAFILFSHAAKLSRKVEEQQTIGTFFEASPNGLLIVGANGLIEMVNEQCETLFGYPRAELLGNPVEILLPESAREHHPVFRDTYLKSPQTRAMGSGRDLSARHKNGTLFPVEIGLSTIRMGTGIKVIASVTDLTDRSNLMNSLLETNKQLNEFAYVASHDLKSPLRGIDQLATWLEEDLGENLEPNIQGHLRLMRTRIKRMEQLLSDLLAYARAGRIVDNIEQVDSAELIKAVFELHNIDGYFKLEMAGDFPTFSTFKAPLELVFRNLFNNAIKHHDLQQGIIMVSVCMLAGFYEFQVADDGPGIPQEHEKRVFDLFQTLRPRDEIEGSGMGLAIVKKTIQAFSGTITLQPNKPRGCKFTFIWPMDCSALATK